MSDLPQLIVFTDLDGSLLDHDSYDWRTARPALQRLHELGAPLLLNSSKTVAEQQELRLELSNPHPFIAENGHVTAIPAGYFEGKTDLAAALETNCTGTSYREIRAILEELRNEHGFRFRGFGDLDTQTVATRCNFSPAAAALAQQRLATEPLQWEDSESALVKLTELLATRNLCVVRGGRFVHVSGPGDKGTATIDLLARYRQMWPGHRLVTVALGDSANDLPMLNAVDHAVVIPPRQGRAIAPLAAGTVHVAPTPGPSGWNLAMLSLLDELGYG